MRQVSALAIICILALALCGCISGEEEPSWSIEVYGDVDNPHVLSYSDLVSLEQGEVEKQLLKSTELYTGALLSAIVSKASPHEGVDAVNFIADDGYLLSFSIEDIDGGILSLRKDGSYLDSNSGPVMLALGIGCACNWMKHVQEIEFYLYENSLGIQGDVTNPMFMTIADIRKFTGKTNDFTIEELFTKAAYYPQAQTFSIMTASGLTYTYDMEKIEGAIVTYSEDGFSVTIDNETYYAIEEIRSIWDPDA